MKKLGALVLFVAAFSWNGQLMAQETYELRCIVKTQGTNDWITVKQQSVDVTGQNGRDGFTGSVEDGI